MTDLPRYVELKRRCDCCDREFRQADLLAAVFLMFDGGSRPYTIIFCFNQDGNMKCLNLWKFKYEVKRPMDFKVMEYHGKRKRGPGGDTGRFPALL